MYSNELENVSSHTTSCEDIVSRVLGTYRKYPFNVTGFQRICIDFFVIDDECLNILCQRVQLPFVQYIDIIKTWV